MLRKNLTILAILIIVIPLAGELKFYPFHNSFRVSLGIPILFFFLLWIRKISLFSSGVIVGVSVVTFRILLDFATKSDFSFSCAFIVHFPTFFYYVTYSCLFYFAKITKFPYNPFIIGFLSVCIDSLSNIVELLFRHLMLGDSITLYIIEEIVVIAIIRTFFVIGLFTMIKFHETELEVYHQQEQNKHMLFLISGLYEETVQLKKSLQNAENITRSCYNLYRNLQNNSGEINIEQLSTKLLGIAGEIHEIKKDNQRIYAGLSKMIADENSTDYIDIEKMSNIIIQTNEKYAYSLGKHIKFVLNIKGSFPPLHVYTILSLVNNLVSNAVEAIKDEGLIKIDINKCEDKYENKEEIESESQSKNENPNEDKNKDKNEAKNQQYIEFRVANDGPRIPHKKKDLIFKPGYTTKFDMSGTPSTGMGLPYVKEIVENLHGKIAIEDNADTNGTNGTNGTNETTFILKLPINNLLERMVM